VRGGIDPGQTWSHAVSRPSVVAGRLTAVSSRRKPAAVGDLIAVPDHQGTLHLAHAWMYYPTYQPDSDEWPNEGFHVVYFSDHPGESVRRQDVWMALDELAGAVWYVTPFREQLAEMRFDSNAALHTAVDQALAAPGPARFVTAQHGEPCPRSGRWILRGAHHSVDLEAGQTMPGYAFFESYPPLWTRWDLPLPEQT